MDGVLGGRQVEEEATGVWKDSKRGKEKGGCAVGLKG